MEWLLEELPFVFGLWIISTVFYYAYVIALNAKNKGGRFWLYFILVLVLPLILIPIYVFEKDKN